MRTDDAHSRSHRRIERWLPRRSQSGAEIDTPANVVVSRAAPRDVPLILQFIRELAEYERAPDEAVATAEGLNVALFGDHPQAEVLLAHAGAEPAGFALFFYNFSTWTGKRGIYLEDIFVRPPMRRHGVGAALFREIARIAVERDCPRLEWAVLNWNELAINFYRKIGATAKDDWTTYRLSGETLRHLARK